MGTISERKLKDGTVRYRAEIRINRQGVVYKESKTFSTARTASNWLKKREGEIESNPDIITGTSKTSKVTVFELITKYLDEIGDQYSITTRRSLRVILKLPIAKIPADKLNSMHITEHVKQRKIGFPSLGFDPIQPSTILNELQHLKSVLNHARLLWGVTVNYAEITESMLQLKKSRQITRGNTRDRLLTRKEIENLLHFFMEKWNRGITTYPMQIIILFAIFTCRRQAEITRLDIRDYDRDNRSFKVKDLKNKNGSKGNHKEFIVDDNVAKLIEIALQPKYRNRMLMREGNTNFIFPLRPGTIATEFNEACALLGLDDLRFHDFRHEGATRLAESGKTIPQIQQYTLHNTWASLERYVSVKIRKNVMTLEEMLHLIGEM